jgi:hypothetical protein
MFQDRIFKRLALTVCLLAISIEGSAGTGGEVEPPPVTAIWRVQQLQLNFRSPRSHYSCEGLKNKITAILTAVGANRSIKVNLPCRADALTNNALALITLATPIEATREIVVTVTTYSPQQQLAARVNGIRLPSATDMERFNAEWRTVALHKESRLRIDSGDCDLLRDLSTQVFPQLGVQLDKVFSCSHLSGSRARPKMRVMALVPIPDAPVAQVGEDPRTR